jgi:hypothetical protein
VSGHSPSARSMSAPSSGNTVRGRRGDYLRAVSQRPVQRQRPRHPQQTEGPSARRPRQARPRNSPSPNIGRQISSQIRARDDRRYAISTRFFLCRQPGATAAFNVLGHFFHRWSGEYESLTSRKRASASSIAARASSRRRSRSTHRASASRTAPSALRTRPSATARPIKPCCSAGSSIWKVCSRLAGPKARMCGNQEIRTGLSSATNSMPVLCADPSGRQFLHRTIKGRRYHRLHLGTG